MDLQGILERIRLAQKNHANGSRPFITLTYAQSVDGSISAEGGAPLPLSGPESLQMTHHLRAMHDAILVWAR